MRRRAHELGIQLQFVPGTGPRGRIGHADLDAYVASAAAARRCPGRLAQRQGIEEVKVIGLRRKIAEQMQESKRRIPHYAYVDEVDMTELEDLRAHLNARHEADRPRLTLLPFLMRALVRAFRGFRRSTRCSTTKQASCIATRAVHIGIATQTPNGLIVPVVRHAEALDLWEVASEIARLLPPRGKARRRGTN